MGARSKKRLGVTLLFYVEEPSGPVVMANSYVAHASSFREVLRVAGRISLAEKTRADERGDKVVYLGVDDLFAVAGGLVHGAMLGRTTLWNLEGQRDYRGLLVERQVIEAKLQNRGDSRWLLAKSVYFVEADTEGDSYTVAANVLVENSMDRDGYELAEQVASAEEILARIRGCGPPTETGLAWVGVEDVVPVRRNLLQGEAFDSMVKSVQSEDEARALVPDQRELQSFFKER